MEKMKDLETAESEIGTLNEDIKRLKTRFRQRELSSEAQRNILEEYKRIKERAENKIEETLLRLHEEIYR